VEALILAAGRGRRLGSVARAVPKCLLRFGGDTLLQRHLDILRHCGVCEVTIAVGYEAEQVMSEIQHLGTASKVRTLYNPDYARGSMVSLWTVRG
jgi:choline kinase